MTDSNAFDFTKFVPGFDFLKNLTPQASSNGTGVPGWVAPTLDPKEIDKRIQELKTVQFWLEQNAKGIAATIQAMEVQRMTLSTLQNMNVNFQDMAESLKVKPVNQAAPEEEKPMQVRMPQMHCPKISLLKKLRHLIKAAQVQLVARNVNHPPRPAHLSRKHLVKLVSFTFAHSRLNKI
jgi:hypothetical protein